jgi:Sulfotransferase family
MLISHQHKFILIHAPKTAGVSISHALRPYCHEPNRLLFNRFLSILKIRVNTVIGPVHWINPRGHSSASQLKRIYPSFIFDNYFKFAFVRNPWDLLVSFYHYIKSNHGHSRYKRLAKLESFEDYINYEIKRNKINQTNFLYSKDKIPLVDFVGRFESLEDDFVKICSIIGIDGRLLHANKTQHETYHEYYDETLMLRVAKHWHEDIANFGYEFIPKHKSS